MKINWSKRKAVLIIHEANTGPGHDLRDYLLKKRIGELLFISHPLLYIKANTKNSSYFLRYKNGKLIEKHIGFHFKLPEKLLYIKDLLYSLGWTITKMRDVDMVFGFGNLNAYAGTIIKWLGYTKKTIYYVIDYVPERFENKFVNNLYHTIEKVAAQYSDVSWNLSPRMIETREQKWQKKFANQIVVPHGVHIERIKHLPYAKVNTSEILYMGTILQKQGIQLVLQSIKQLIKKVPKIHFTIIGRGPYEPELQKLTKKLKIEKYVTFLGYVESHEEMENRIAQAGITVALYDKKYDKFSYYSDPGKIKNYLGAGVPIVMTDVPYVARQVEKAKCGFIVEYNESALVKVLLQYFTDEKLMKRYRINALRFARGYSWESVFDKAFEESHI